MKKILCYREGYFWSTTIFVAVIALSLTLLHNWQPTPVRSSTQRLTQITPILQSGDLIFRTGRDLQAHAVLVQSRSARYSHVGIIHKYGQELFVIHAIPESDHQPAGVVEQPLREFLSAESASDFGAYRVRQQTPATGRAITLFAKQQLGKPFDLEFLFSDNSALYCTELVLKALAQSGLDIKKTLHPTQALLLKEGAYTPDDLSKSPLLRPISS